MKKERDSRFELLRIFAMCGIIIMHYFNGDMGGMSNYAVIPNFLWFFMHFCLSFCAPLVNCFVLITGFFMIDSTKLSLRKPVEMLIITGFYGIVMYLVSVLLHIQDITLSGVFYALFPFFNGKRWFIESYIILIMFAPYLNKVLKNISQQAFRILIGVQLVLFSVWYSIGLSAPLLDDGYGITNFITLYMLGAYLRLYGEKSDLIRRISRNQYFILFSVSSVLTFLLSYFINPYGYAFITVIASSMFLFLTVYQMKSFSNPTINTLSSSALDVYFAHSDINTSHFIFNNVFGENLIGTGLMVIPHILLVVPCIYIIGFFIGVLRKKLFENTFNRWTGNIKWLNYQLEI